MRRFDVFRLKPDLYVVNIQADILSDTDTRIVIPLIPLSIYKEVPFPRLMPIIPIDGQDYVLVTMNMGPQRKAVLKHHVTNIEAFHQSVTDSIDFLLQGY